MYDSSIFLFSYFISNPFEDSIVSLGSATSLIYDLLLRSTESFAFVLNCIIGDNTAGSSYLFLLQSSNLFYTFFAIMIFVLCSTFRSTILFQKNNIFFLSFTQLFFFVYDKMISPYILYNDARLFVKYFLFLFLLILCNNMHGLLAFGFSLTSNLSYTFFLSMSSWFCIVLHCIAYNSWSFVCLFMPSSLPFVMFPLFIGIETLSFLIRMISLALRIFANIVSGHLLIETLCNLLTIFIVGSTYSIDIFDFPFFLQIGASLVCILLFELCIGMLQAYIFVTLLIIYLQDVYNCVH